MPVFCQISKIYNIFGVPPNSSLVTCSDMERLKVAALEMGCERLGLTQALWGVSFWPAPLLRVLLLSLRGSG